MKIKTIIFINNKKKPYIRAYIANAYADSTEQAAYNDLQELIERTDADKASLEGITHPLQLSFTAVCFVLSVLAATPILITA